MLEAMYYKASSMFFVAKSGYTINIIIVYEKLIKNSTLYNVVITSYIH